MHFIKVVLMKPGAPGINGAKRVMNRIERIIQWSVLYQI